MNIGIFAYNFPHKKTQEGILNLLLHHYPLACILAANPVELKFYQSKMRIAPQGLEYRHPQEIAARFGIPYHVVVHNSLECEELIRKYKLDLGIILGARILKEHIINAFNIGILNLHPGLLPHNRGLDNIKWAILKGYKQGVSTHLIDAQVDRGRLILQREMDVHEDDTLLDLFLRVQNMEQVLMIESLRILEAREAREPGNSDFPAVGEGNYFPAVPPEEEATLLVRFEGYKKGYKELGM